tara:strand:+ start:1415 stop:1711 length:297 start_codon:yes stop_codon:yes gene_type:complete
MENTMSYLKHFKTALGACNDLVNSEGNLPKISHELTKRNKALRHHAQPTPQGEMLEFKIDEPNGFDSHPKRIKAPTEKDLLLDTEEVILRKFGNEVFN